MLIIGLDNKEYKINFAKYAHSNRVVSAGHKRARVLLQQMYPFDRAVEEVTLPGTNGPLYADFLIPTRRIMIEVHGKQHYEFTPFFHKNKIDFIRAQARDRNKERWCELNDIQYIALKDTESDDEWRTIISEATAC